MKQPTDDEIVAEIATLRKMKPTVLLQSAFGENHHDAIDAQIEAMEMRMDENEAEEQWADHDDNVRYAALNAAQWMAGDSEDGSPSEGWKSLVRK